MKHQDPALLAPLLLLLALTLLALAEFMGASGYWAWVKAGAEAAAVGGMADWFAVVVLFRHPLGIPIPHTAIIPKSKARIADSMAEFVHAHFLQRDKLLAKLADFNVARHLGEWLQQAMQVQHFVQGVRKLLLGTLHTLDDAPMRQALTDALTTQAQRWNAASTLGQTLDLVTKDNRHQQVLNMGLEKVAALLEAPQVGEFLGQQIIGCVTNRPVGIPFFSCVANSASVVPPVLHSSRKAASAGLLAAACNASGCSAATAQNVTPMMVSARVVKTYILPSPIKAPSAPVMVCGKANRTPSLFPIDRGDVPLIYLTLFYNRRPAT